MKNEEPQDVALENNEETVEETTTETDKETVDYKAEALKWKAIAERNAKKPKTIIQTQEQSKPSDILKSPEFRLHREGYNEDEIEVIMKNGGPDILKDEKNIVTVGLRGSRDQRRAEDAASKASEASGLSEIERKYTEQDLRNMKKEDLEKLLPHTNN